MSFFRNELLKLLSVTSSTWIFRLFDNFSDLMFRSITMTCFSIFSKIITCTYVYNIYLFNRAIVSLNKTVIFYYFIFIVLIFMFVSSPAELYWVPFSPPRKQNMQQETHNCVKRVVSSSYLVQFVSLVFASEEFRVLLSDNINLKMDRSTHLGEGCLNKRKIDCCLLNYLKEEMFKTWWQYCNLRHYKSKGIGSTRNRIG